MAILGLNCVLYRGEAGQTASTEMKNIKDVELNLTTGEADITTRAANGWRSYAATLKEASLTFQMNYESGDADLTAIRNAFMNHSAIAFLVGDDSGNGLDADFVITEFNIPQPLEEAVTVSVTARPTFSTRAPAWKTAGA
ncbi:MAG: phage tail tube protein [Treponema sp.]|nr:phage tail tube protein [Treponema sp.]